MRKLGKFAKKVDDACIPMNVVLSVLAVGLAVLVFTMFISNIVISDIKKQVTYMTPPQDDKPVQVTPAMRAQIPAY